MVEKTDILILNGPNLNMLGVREPDIYGHESLNDVEHMCRDRAQSLKMGIDFRRSNFEGELATIIQKARDNARGIIINPAAYTHTSVAIQDALKLAELPVVELHLSNPHAREPFRHNSYVSPVAAGIICGFGSFGYILAIDAIARLIDSK